MKWSSQADAKKGDIGSETLESLSESISVTLADNIQHHHHLGVLQANKDSQSVTLPDLDLAFQHLRQSRRS